MQFEDSVYWTESTSVLKYIRNETSRFKCFVANRVAEITQWRYVNSSGNPADLTSRGISQVKSSHLYLYSAFNNTNCYKALHSIKIGKLCQ